MGDAKSAPLCCICKRKIPPELSGDTQIWRDIRFELKVGPEGGLGPFLCAHTACLAASRLVNAPCPTCGNEIWIIPSTTPRVDRGACGACKREFERHGEQVTEVPSSMEAPHDAPAPPAARPAKKGWLARRRGAS